jgi:hypothetical protein
MLDDVQAWYTTGKKRAVATSIAIAITINSTLTPHEPGDTQVLSLICALAAAAAIVAACSPMAARLRLA